MLSLATILLVSIAAFTDIRRGEIDDWISQALLALGVLAGIRESDLHIRLLWVFAVFVPLFIAAVIRSDGIGGGDIKLYSALAMVLKENVISVIFISCFAAVIYALFAGKMKSAVRMGPFILVAVIATKLMNLQLI